MAPHCSTLAWKIPWTEEPCKLQSMGSRRVRHNWAISLSLFTFMHWRRKWQPTPVFLPGTGEPGGLPSMGLHRVRHDWSDLAAAAAAAVFHLVNSRNVRMGRITYWKRTVKYIYIYIYIYIYALLCYFTYVPSSLPLPYDLQIQALTNTTNWQPEKLYHLHFVN